MTKEWGVTSRSSSGTFGRSFLVQAADEVNTVPEDKPIRIYYIGDLDAGGLMIERAAREGNGKEGRAYREGLYQILQSRHGWSEEQIEDRITWERLALTADEFLTLPESVRVAAKSKDNNLAEYRAYWEANGHPEFVQPGQEVGAEVEALPLQELRDRVEETIKDAIDWPSWRESEGHADADESKLVEWVDQL